MKNTKLVWSVIAVLVVVGVVLVIRSKNNIVPVAQVSNPLNITYVVGGQSFNLVNGKAELVTENSSSKNTLFVFGEPVYGDLDKDGDNDAVVLLVNNPGGSGTFYYAALAINNNGAYSATGTMLLGDRIAPQTVEIQDGHALYNFAERKGTDPMSTPPSIGKSVWVYYNAKDNTIGEWVKNFEGETDNKTLINSISVNDKYIHPLKWPPVVTVLDSNFICNSSGSNTQGAGKTSLVTFKGSEYCVTSLAQGAAGSTYTEYSYTKKYGNKTAKLDFTIQSVQCLNYDEPNKTECINKQANFDILPIIQALFFNYK